jgi:uncharacterized DUF497 family protein
MEYEWDEVKRRRNLTKHGVDFPVIIGFDWASAITALDVRRDYDEIRYVSFGFIGKRLHACVYARRGRKRRIISLRKANKREEAIYENTIFDE